MGYVYFIDDQNGLTKIGWTKKLPEKRLKQFQIPGLILRFSFKTKYHPAKLEKALHRRFDSHLKGREWFDLNEFNDEYILECCNKLNDGLNAVFMENPINDII